MKLRHYRRLGDHPHDEILAEIKEREARRAEIKADLARLPGSGRVLPFDRAKLREEIHMRLTAWQAIVRRNPHEARQLLMALLKGRLRFEPKQDTRGRYYEFSGEGSVSALIGGAISPEVVVTPGGYASITSWPTLPFETLTLAP